jgi:hypothetical protein
VKEMSRLIEKLTRIRQTETQPMGFMLTKKATEKPRMQLVVFINSTNRENLSAVAESADAVMVEVIKADDLNILEKVCQSREGMIGGGWLRSSGAGISKKAFGAACDFMVFPPAIAIDLLPKEKTACILELDASLSDVLQRTVNDLPVEGVLIFDKDVEDTLTLRRLMQVQRVAYLVSKPILMVVPAGYSQDELQALWDAGVAAVVVEPTDSKSIEKLADMHKVLDNLVPPISRKKERIRAILPHLQPEAEKPPQEGEEEEDE